MLIQPFSGVIVCSATCPACVVSQTNTYVRSLFKATIYTSCRFESFELLVNIVNYGDAAQRIPFLRIADKS